MAEIRIGRHILQPNRQLLLDGEHVHLGPRALSILTVLAEADGEVVTKDELMNAVWPIVTVEDNALQVHVTAVRKALGADAERLHTLRGIGYQLSTGNDDHAPQRHDQSMAEVPLGRIAEDVLARRVSKRWPALLGAVVIMVGVAFAAWWIAGTSAASVDEEGIYLSVVPFEETGGESASALATGITDELIVRLRRIPELRIARGEWVSTEGLDPANLYKVSGSIRTSNGEVRLYARLTDHEGGVVWSESFDRRQVDLLYMEEEIARSVASALSIPLDVGVESTEYGGTNNAEAFASYLEGTSHSFEPDKSIPAFERAVELDPGYIRAMARLAEAHAIALTQVRTEEESRYRLDEFNRYAQLATEQAPTLWIGPRLQGWAHILVGNLVEAERLRAVVEARDPGNDPEVKTHLGNMASQFGRIADGLAIRRSMALLDPIYRTDGALIWNLVLAGEHEAAIAMWEDYRDVYESDVFSSMMAQEVYWSYVLTENWEGIASLPTRFDRFGDRPLLHDALRDFGLGGSDFPDLLLPALRDWANRQFGEAGGTAQLTSLGLRAGYLGRHELAVNYMRIGYERPATGFYHQLWHPALAETRKTPEYAQLIADLGFPEAWRESGDWGDYCRPVSDTEIACE